MAKTPWLIRLTLGDCRDGLPDFVDVIDASHAAAAVTEMLKGFNTADESIRITAEPVRVIRPS